MDAENLKPRGRHGFASRHEEAAHKQRFANVAATPHASLQVLYVFFSKKCKVAVSVYVRTSLLGQGYRRPTARRRGSNTGQTKNPFLGSQLCATKPGHQETTESEKYHGQHPTAESSTSRSTTLSDERSVDSHLKTSDA